MEKKRGQALIVRERGKGQVGVLSRLQRTLHCLAVLVFVLLLSNCQESEQRRGELSEEELEDMHVYARALGRLESEDSLLKAVRLRRELSLAFGELGRQTAKGVALDAIGVLYLRLGLPDSANPYVDSAIAIFQQQEAHYQEGVALAHKGRLYLQLEESDSAVVTYRLAVDLLERFGSVPRVTERVKEVLDSLCSVTPSLQGACSEQS